MGSLRVCSCWGSGSACWGPCAGPVADGSQQPPPPPEAQSAAGLDAPRTEVEALPIEPPGGRAGAGAGSLPRCRGQRDRHHSPARAGVRDEGTAAADRRATIGRPAQREGGVDLRLLGMGRGWRPLRLGRGELAGPARRDGLGGRPLDARCRRMVLGPRQLGSARESPGDRRESARLAGDRAARPNNLTTRRRRHPGPTSSTCPVITPRPRPAIAWPGSPASGPRSSPAGTGSRPDGSAARTAGTSAKATGCATRPRPSSSSASRHGPSAAPAAMPNVTVITRDPITGAEVDIQADGAPGARRRGGRRHALLCDPAAGRYPYGPNGVIVPGTVPPFVRRMLDRVLP